jgi:glycosyltransferase involved in cell wall biosynthesis
VTVRPRPFRLAVLSSHAAQYRAPLFRRLAREPWLDLEVYYFHEYGLKPHASPWGVTDFQWDRDLGSGYRWRVLANLSKRPSVDRFWGEINPGVLRILYSRHHDAVLHLGWGSATAAAAVLISRASPTSSLFLIESNLFTIPRSHLLGAVKPIAMRALLSSASGVLAIGTKNREFFLEHGVREDRIFHCPYTVDVPFFTGAARVLAPRREELRRKLGAAKGDVVFLFVGQLIARKNPLGLVDAFEAVQGRAPSARLVIVGNGALRECIGQRVAANHRITLVGFKNQTELPDLYAAADVFVLPSHEETWGLVVNEAMCFGLPLITTRQMGSTYDLVNDRGTGLVVDSRDTQGLAAAMLRLASSPDTRLAMGEAGRRTIGGWTYEEDVRGFLAAAERVLEHRTHRAT